MVYTVRAARVHKGLTQAEVAKRMGLSVPSYARIENDTDLMTIGRAKQLSDVLGMSVEDIIFGPDSSDTGVESGSDE